MIKVLRIPKKNQKIMMMIKLQMHMKMETLLGMERVSLHLESTAVKDLMATQIYLKMAKDQLQMQVQREEIQLDQLVLVE